MNIPGFIGSLVIFALLVGTILYLLFSHPRGYRMRSILLASLAGRWNGQVREGGIFGGDSLDLRVDDIPGEVTFGETVQANSDYQGGWTLVRFNWASDRRLRVAPEGLEKRLRRMLGSNDIEFDDPYFDDRFWVESSHPSWARQILTRETRVNLVRLRESPEGGPGDDVILGVGPHGVTLRVSRIVVDSAGLLGPLVETAIAVLRAARELAEPSGVALGDIRPAPEAACPICGHAITDGPLSCPSCRTPHHRDCWKYFGGCAIFGCASRARRSAS